MNIKYDDLLKTLLNAVNHAGVKETNLLSFPAEPALNSKPENQKPGQFKGKLSEHSELPWTLQSLGYKGVFLALVYFVQLITWNFFRKSFVHTKLWTLRPKLFLSMVLDFIRLCFRNIPHASMNAIDDFWKALSFSIAVFLLVSFSWEVIYSFIEINRLYKIEPDKQTETDKIMAEMYFDGLDKQGVKKSWWVRNFNVLFIFHLVLILLFIFNLQYL